jgi:hypothetical protein
MNEECHLDAATGQENNAAPFPMAYAQCRLALSRRPPEPGRQNRAAGTRTPEPGGRATGAAEPELPDVHKKWSIYFTQNFIIKLKMGTDGPSPNLGACCHKSSGDLSSRGRFVQGTHCPEGAMFQKSRGRIITGTGRAGTHRQGTLDVSQGLNYSIKVETKVGFSYFVKYEINTGTKLSC